ncbi:hypothetical protein BGX38DRAFT_1277511 [Terfezia claveryi]|nr:hypothetical protein BGX38DRAFT_1277511 [Terfezia claveryi]
MLDRPQKKSKTTGKASASLAPESAMQKKKSTREGPASSVGKRPELIQKQGMITHKALAAQTTEHVLKKRKRRAELSPSIEDVIRRRRTRAELALVPPPVKDVPTRRRTRAELAFYLPPIMDVPRTRTAKLTEDGSREFNPDTEFSGGRNVWGTSTNPHTKNIKETHKKLLGPPLSWEHTKDWKRQKVNRLNDIELGNFTRVVQRTWDLMFIHKQAYILYYWYQLSDDQKRLYLELEEQQELPDFQIPNGELEVIGVKPVHQFAVVINVMLTIQEELAEGSTNNYLSDEVIGTDIEEDYDDKSNKQDDDEDTGL